MDSRWGYQDDVDALARTGGGPEDLDEMGRLGLEPGMFAEYASMDLRARMLIAKLLADGPADDAAFDEMDGRPDGKQLADWLLRTPKFRMEPGALS